MATNYWVKLYYAILDDQKIRELPDWLWRRLIEWFLICNKYYDVPGEPSDETTAWELHTTPDEIARFRQALEDYDLVGYNIEGISKIGELHMSRSIAVKMDYKDYLATEHWETIRGAALRRADNHCEQCDACGEDVILDVHHLTYERIGEEEPSDLKVLCRSCHKAVHGRSNG